MAFDKTQPQGSTKIRNLGDVITPNWDAIESADSTFLPQGLNLADRDSIGGLASTPTAIADAVIAFSKQDDAGKPQLFTIDPDSVISQLTGNLFTTASPGRLLLPNGFMLIWGTETASTAWISRTFPTFGGVVGFPNNCFHISGSANGSTKIVGFQLESKTKFKTKSTDVISAFYLAIGN